MLFVNLKPISNGNAKPIQSNYIYRTQCIDRIKWFLLLFRILTGETFRVLLYVQENFTWSAGSASTSHRTSIECIFIEPTEVCSVPGLHRGASGKNHRAHF